MFAAKCVIKHISVHVTNLCNIRVSCLSRTAAETVIRYVKTKKHYAKKLQLGFLQKIITTSRIRKVHINGLYFNVLKFRWNFLPSCTRKVVNLNEPDTDIWPFKKFRVLSKRFN